MQNVTKYHISVALTSSQTGAKNSRIYIFLTSKEFYIFTFCFYILFSSIALSSVSTTQTQEIFGYSCITDPV